MQERLSARTEVALRQAHAFLGARCDGMVARVLARIAQETDRGPGGRRRAPRSATSTSRASSHVADAGVAFGRAFA